MAKAGRIAKNTAVAPEPQVNDEELRAADVAMRQQAQEDQADLVDLAMGVGALQAFSLIQKFASVAQVRLFKRVRESKQINKLPIRMPDGSIQKFELIVEACPVLFGRSFQAMRDAEDRFDVMGEEVYEAACRLRLNDSALRAARALPPEKLETVRLAISNGSSKAEVLSVIEDLAEKIESAEKQVAELQAENTASEELLSKRDATIKRLEREVKRFEKLPPDEKLLALQKDVADAMNDARGAVLGRMRQAVIALINSGDDRHAHDVFLAGMVGQVQAELAQLRQEFDLPDVSTAAEATLAAEVAQWAGKN